MLATKLSLYNTKLSLYNTKLSLNNTKLSLNNTKLSLYNTKLSLYNTKLSFYSTKRVQEEQNYVYLQFLKRISNSMFLFKRLFLGPELTGYNDFPNFIVGSKDKTEQLLVMI